MRGFSVCGMHLWLSVCPFASALTCMSVSRPRPFSCSSHEEMPALRTPPQPSLGIQAAKQVVVMPLYPAGSGCGPSETGQQNALPLPPSSELTGIFQMPGLHPWARSCLPLALGYCSQAAAQPSTPAGPQQRRRPQPGPASQPWASRMEEHAGMRASPPG